MNNLYINLRSRSTSLKAANWTQWVKKYISKNPKWKVKKHLSRDLKFEKRKIFYSNIKYKSLLLKRILNIVII